MTTVAHIELKANQLMIDGQIDFSNADNIYQQGLGLLMSVKTWPVLIDLSRVEQGNTLLLAIVLQWLKHCPDVHSLQLSQVPAKMRGILQASHLESLLLN